MCIVVFQFLISLLVSERLDMHPSGDNLLLYGSLDAFIHICVCVCVYTRACVYTHIYIHANPRRIQNP